MPEIVICEFMDEGAVAWLRERADVHYDPALVEDRAQLHAAIREVPALIVRSSARIDRALLDAAPALQVIGRLGVGLERFDLPACAERGVAVVKADGANARSVAEYTISMTLTLLRRGAYHATEAVAGGAWPREALIGHETSGRTLGIVGMGEIGRRVVPRAVAMGLRVLGCDPYIPQASPVWDHAERCGLDDLLAVADIVTLHTPLTDETHHMIDAAALARMKPGAILINSARGPVIDACAVADALRSGQLGGAAIDVYEDEPLTASTGAMFEGLSNLILTPHVAGVTVESNARVSRMTAEKTLAVLRSC